MASRSPSPGPRTPEPTPCPRRICGVNSTSNSPFRRSLSELPQKVSGYKGVSPRSSFEQKENDGDLNFTMSNRGKSSSLKGTKNFMAPTISASSKAVPSLHKKKVLSERNDCARSSVSSISDDEYERMDAETCTLPENLEDDKRFSGKSKGVSNQNVQSTLQPKSNNQSFSGPQNLSKNFESEMNQSSFGSPQYVSSCVEPRTNQPVPNSPTMAPLDADPSLPPYDLEKNYLSPRPHFLHYRPNPRIGLYLNQKAKLFGRPYAKQLEDSFSSESSGDASPLSDETQSSDQKTGLEEEPLSSEVESEIEAPKVEFEPVIVPNSTGKSKSRMNSLCKLRLIPLVFVLVASCFLMPMIDTPMESPWFRSDQPLAMFSFLDSWFPADSCGISPLSKTVEVGVFRIKELAHTVPKWPVFDRFARFSLIGTDPREYKIGQCPRVNSTALFSVELISGIDFDGVQNDDSPEISVFISEQNSPEDTTADISCDDTSEAEAEEGSNLEFACDLINTDDETQDGIKKLAQDQTDASEFATSDVEFARGLSETVAEIQGGTKTLAEDQAHASEFATNSEQVDEETSMNVEPPTEIQQMGYEITSSPSNNKEEIANPGSDESRLGHPDAENELHEQKESNEEEQNSEEKSETSEDTNFIGTTDPKLARKLSVGTKFGFASVVLAMAVVLLSIYVKKKLDSVSVPEVSIPKKAVSASAPSVGKGRIPEQSPVYRNAKVDVENLRESGPVEVGSSFYTSASTSWIQSKKANEEEIQSQERKSRRESTVSSSTFGSFTTLEKLPGKKDKDEALTPVRRSSRIRSRVTSP